MNLDLNTIALMNIALCLIVTLFLFIARASLRDVNGSEYWVLANVLVSAGLLLLAFNLSQNPITFTVINLLIAGGLSFNLIGMQKFNDDAADFRPVIGVVVLLLVSNTFMTITGVNIHAMYAFNYLIVAYVDLSCAYVLFSMKALPKRTVVQMNAALFLSMGLLMLWRGLSTLTVSAGDTRHFVDSSNIDNMFSFAGAIKLLCTSLCFMIMMHQKHALKLSNLAMVDELTNIFNRRGLMDAAEMLRANCSRINKNMSLIVLDLDHFKTVNDEHGHPVGDQVLKAFAESVKQEVRAGDVFGRYGGEEFCVICPNTEEPEAAALAERIRYAFCHTDIEIRKVKERFTVSAGVSCSSQVGFDFRGMLAAADSALYIAKNQGRNQVVSHTAISVI
jgi:diguanylate cyclase